MQEIERKYLLKDSILLLIAYYNLKADKITQYYTTITPVKGIRYRRIGDVYFKTVKHGTGAAREEIEVEIPKLEFQKNLKDRIKSDIRKNRYLFHFEGYAYSIDVFKKALKGFYILEIEFPDMKAFEAFTLPDILQTHVIKEVSFDESYKNKNIVLHGRPPTSYQMDALFKALETKSIDALDHYFIPNLTPIDALRLILYKFSLNILAYKERLLLHNNMEDLHQFRVNIRKSRAFLKEFGFLIPKKYFSYLNQNLEDFATRTNQKRDLDVIQARLSTLGKEHKMIKKDIRDKSEYEQHAIEKMLKSKSFEDFFDRYQDILTQNTLLTSENSAGSIENCSKQVITYLHHKIVKKVIILEKNFDSQKLHKIRISLKKLRYLLEELQHIYGQEKREKIKKIIDKGKKLQTLLGEYNDAVHQQKLLHDYFKQNKQIISHRKQLEHTLLETTIQIQDTLMIRTKKELHAFKNEPFRL